VRTRVKVCCISSHDEARMAIAGGASALGLVGDMPSGPSVIDDLLAKEIASRIPPTVETFLLTSRDDGRDIADHARFCGTTTVQIVRHIDVREYPVLIERLPMVRRVQVIHVEDEGAVELTRRYEPFVHAFLLDSGRPSADVPELGGTGRSHDWHISRQIVQSTTRPVFLAGGLNPDNVQEAIRVVQPFGVDLCSGIRRQNRLDETKLRDFMTSVWNA